MDVGESPIHQSEVFCSAALVPGTMSMCSEFAALKEVDGKMVVQTRLLEGGNRGTGMNIPLCARHLAMWDTDPSSFEVVIPPTPPASVKR